jgi:hypothetical protein
MDIFLKNKFLLRLVLFLVIVNLIALGYLWWYARKEHLPPPQPDFEKLAAILKDKLQLTDKQVLEFKNIREDFFRKEKKLSQTIKAQRDSMNTEMFKDKTDTLLVKNIAQRVAENEYQMELYRIEQAHQLQKLCTPDQLKKFNMLVIEIRDYFKPGKTDVRPAK